MWLIWLVDAIGWLVDVVGWLVGWLMWLVRRKEKSPVSLFFLLFVYALSLSEMFPPNSNLPTDFFFK
jgi:hypothetical protein